MDALFTAIASNIWILIPLTAIIGGLATGVAVEYAGSKKLKEENEMLKDLLANKERQLNHLVQHTEKLDAIEASIKQLPGKSEGA